MRHCVWGESCFTGRNAAGMQCNDQWRDEAAQVICNQWYSALQRKSQLIVMRYFNILPPECTDFRCRPHGYLNQHLGITNARYWSSYWCRYHGTCDGQCDGFHVCNCTTIFGLLCNCFGRHLANVGTVIVGSRSSGHSWSLIGSNG